MKLTKLPVSLFRTCLIILIVLITAAFYLLRLEGLTGSYFSTTISIVALFITLFSIKTLLSTIGGGPLHSGFSLIFLGNLWAQLGLILWLLLTIIGQSDLANSISTILFLSTYILNFIGYIKIAITAKVDVREFMGLIVGFSILGFVLLTISYATHFSSLNLVSLGYIAGDFLRMIVIATILQMVITYQGGLLGRYWLSLFIGNLFITIANLVSTLLPKQYASGLWPYTLIDLIFIGGYLFVAHGFYGIGDSIRLAQKNMQKHRLKANKKN